MYKILIALIQFVCFISFTSVALAKGEMEGIKAPDNKGSYHSDIKSNTTVTSIEEAKEWVNDELHDWMGLGENDQLDLRPSSRSMGKYTFYAIEQKHHNIPIIGLEATFSTQNNKPDYILGRNHSLDNLKYKPTVTKQQAIRNSKVIVENEHKIRLVYWRKSKTDITLSYEVTGTYENDNSTSEEKVYVNALTGKIHIRIPLERTAKRRHVLDVESACRDLGINRLVHPRKMKRVLSHAIQNYNRKEGDAPTGKRTTDYFYNLLGSAYTFIKSTYNMDSLDNRGVPLIGFGRLRFHSNNRQCVGNQFQAQWNGKALFVPDSALKYTEIVAHELAHGIVSNGSRLIYQNQSGALDESISDAIGITFRAWLESGGKENRPINRINTNRKTWQLRMPGRIMRDMKNPKNANNRRTDYPDHYNEFVHLPNTKAGDWGGVHINSSIINQAFYLLSEGGKHPRRGTGPRVKGIGIKKASQIFTLAASTLLTPTADFKDARNAFARAAQVLFGKHSKAWIAVHKSMDVVGVPGSWSIPPRPRPRPQPQPENVPTPAPEPQRQPTPVPTPAPVPQESSQTGIWLALMLLGLGLVIVVLVKMRPKDNQVTRQFEFSNNESDENNNGSINQNTFGHLEALDGSESIPLNNALLDSEEGLIIGRAHELVHVVMENKDISRRHSRIKLFNSQLYIEDMNSTYGTQVDGVKLSPFKPSKIGEQQIVRFAGFSYQLKLS